jgi:hypothetical protein
MKSLKLTLFVFVFMVNSAIGDSLRVDTLAASTITVDGLNVTSMYDVNDVVWAIETLLNDVNSPGIGITTLECDPCKCPSSGEMSSCYEWMAEKERAKEADYKRIRDILENLKE